MRPGGTSADSEEQNVNEQNANEKNRIPLIIGVVIVIVLGALGLALLVTSDDDESSGSDTTLSTATADTGSASDTTADDPGTTEGTEPAAVSGESFPVTITGDPLADYEGDPDPAVGVAAPVVDGQSFDGSAQSIGGPSDGPTMLVFLAHWCPHCNDEIPEIIELQERGDLPEDLNIIGISTAVAEGEANYPPSEWMEEKGWPWPVLADSVESEAIIAYGGTGFPYTTILDDGGNVLARVAGASSADDILAWINAALS